MFNKLTLLLCIFFVGELIFNLSVFKYIKAYFSENKEDTKNKEDKKEEAKVPPRAFLFLNISTFKGMLERLVLFIGLLLNMTQILIVFGTLKIGSRFDKNAKVLNDYFIIGNFISILISILYHFCYTKLEKCFHL